MQNLTISKALTLEDDEIKVIRFGEYHVVPTHNTQQVKMKSLFIKARGGHFPFF